MNSWTDENGTHREDCKLLFFAGKYFLGENAYDPGSTPALGYRRGGTLFVCRSCGDVWGRILLSNSQGNKESFSEVCDVACEKHTDQWNIPGSFLSGHRNIAYLELLPPAALKREFEIHLKHLSE